VKATARRATGNASLKHEVDIRGHRLTTDEPRDHGGRNEGPTPEELLAASLASCTATTMEMYAIRKGWDVGEISVEVNYEPAQRGSLTRFDLVVRLPKDLPEEQRERLLQVGCRCPVHRALEGEVAFEERVALS
jgi:putative redox protein